MTGATRADRGKLGGLRHRQVVRLLAAAEISQTEIARRFNVSQPAVSQFASKHAEEIAAVREKMDDEFAGLAIASKVNRVAAYEELYEVAVKPTPKIAPNGKIVREMIKDPDTDELVEVTVNEVDVRSAAGILKNVAEEMGQLVQRSQVSGDMTTTTTYKIAGVDPSDLT
jgi:predicted transcriptional regulator